MPPAAMYKVLLLTSDPGAMEEVDAIARAQFPATETVFWEFGNPSTKAEVIARIEATDYNLILSYINGIILKPHHLARATFGAVNIHPAPPEHGGCWGVWCQPVIRRDVRAHHGVTVHEIDEHIDHGPIYFVERWDVSPEDSIESVMIRSGERCLALYKQTVEALAATEHGTRSLARLDEQWDPGNRYHSVDDVRTWFRDLDAAHPAHRERVWLNHPMAIASPPYFSDSS